MMTLNDLINETVANTIEGESRSTTLLSILRQKHFWPALQMKRFFDKSGLVLLHNTYKRVDVDDFRELYDQCRSVVLDLDAPEGKNVIVNLAHSIPDRLTTEQYKAQMTDNDVCEVAYEGTVVSVYEHNGKWYFGTTSCPSIDSSRFFHPTKTHGEMFDDVLRGFFPELEGSQELRDAFSAKLDVKKSYAFVLVHHENKHVMDYTSEMGSPSYAALYHIVTRDRETMEEDPIVDTQPFKDMGIRYTRRFDSPLEACEYLSANMGSVYGVIVKTPDNHMFKVSHDDIVKHEEFNLGNPNKWVNMLSVYLQSKKHFQVNDYIEKYAPDLQFPVDENGRELAPTYIIHTVVCTMRDILYHWYVKTTTYNPQVGRFRMNKETDASLPPNIRFHLAQLRHLQVSDHSHAYITPRVVYAYICHHQTLKNIITMIKFFASTGGFNMTYSQAQCFAVLSQLLA